MYESSSWITSQNRPKHRLNSNHRLTVAVKTTCQMTSEEFCMTSVSQ